MMKRGQKIDPKIVDFYNEKAIRLWEEKFCRRCDTCSRMIPDSQRDSHKKLCVPIPTFNSAAESIPEAMIKDFPYEPKKAEEGKRSEKSEAKRSEYFDNRPIRPCTTESTEPSYSHSIDSSSFEMNKS